MKCSFERVQSGNKSAMRCVVCGRTVSRTSGIVVANCRASNKTPAVNSSPGLGDMVAAGLSAVGITKERVSALVGGDCGCQARQEALNRLGHKLGIGGPLVDKPPTAD